MSAVMKRTYRRIEPLHLGYARGRFEALASTSAVRAEIKQRWGADYPHSALHYHWKIANERNAARAAAVSSDSDPADEAQ